MRHCFYIAMLIFLQIVCFSDLFARGAVELTPEEQAWLQKHQIIRTNSEPDYAPFDFQIQGEPAGYSIDYIRLVAERLGIKLVFIKDSWGNILKKARKREIDLVHSIFNTPPERRKFLHFTRHYKQTVNAVITRKDVTDINSFEDLSGRSVALVKGDSAALVARKKLSGMRITEVTDYEEALKAVAFGNADATLTELPVASYMIRTLLLSNLKVAAEVSPLGRDQHYRLAVRKDWPEFVPILEKAMNAISREEMLALDDRWMKLPDSSTKTELPETAGGMRWVRVIMIGFIVCIIIVLLLVLNRLLERSRKDPITYLFSSTALKRNAVLFNGILIIITTTLSWYSLDNIKSKVKKDMKESLQTVLFTTHEVMNIWIRDQKEQLKTIAADPRIIRLARGQLRNYRAGRDLLLTYELKELRKIFRGLQSRSAHIGFFVIAPDGTSVASLRDQNIASSNLIWQKRPDLIKFVLKGSTVFVPPVESDVPLNGAANIAGSNRPPTMFFASPIRDDTDKIIAVLTERFDPQGDFSRINLLGRIGKTGETYTFDSQGRLLSKSRFLPDLISAGFLKTGEQSILSVVLKDPGVNLASGEKSRVRRDKQPLTHMAANAIASKKPGFNLEGYRDYRGVPVIGVWMWDYTHGIGMTTEIDQIESLEAYHSARTALVIIVTITVVVSVVFTLLIMLLGSRGNRTLQQAHVELEERIRERTAELQKLSSAVEQSPVSVLITDKDGTIEYVNPKFTEVSGYTRNEVIGQNPRILKSGKQTEHFYKKMWNRITSGKNWSGELLNRKKNGQMFWERVAIAPLFDPQRNIIHYVAVKEDITEAKRIQDALESSYNLMRIMDKASVEEILQYCLEEAVRLSGSSIGYFHFVNPDQMTIRLNLWSKATMEQCYVGEKATHYPIAEAGIWVDCIHQRKPVIHNDYKKEKHKKGLPKGHVPLTRDLAVPVFEGENIVAIIGVGNSESPYDQFDINQVSLLAINTWTIVQRKKEGQELIVAKEAAEAANRAKSMFLSNMSHEIRTPMNAILGHAQILMRDRELTQAQSDSIHSISKSGEHLLALINDILDMSKIEVGKIKITPVVFRLHNMLNEIREMFWFRVDHNKVALNVEIDESLPNIIKADENRVRQVLINLVGNAVKFTEQGSITVSGILRDDQVLLTVADTGCGIAPDQHESVFGAFEQSNRNIKQTEGTGLGLTISRNMARLMGGDLTLLSESGKGSRFFFSFNFETGSAADISDSGDSRIVRSIKKGQKEIKVLVVDDKEENRKIARLLLEQVGFSIREVGSGEEAIEQCKEWGPRVILMDIVMPGMDGRKATRIIKNSDYGRQVRIIAVSASAFDQDRDEIMTQGADAFVKKPYKERELFEAIRQQTGIEYEYEDRIYDYEQPVPDMPEKLSSLPVVLKDRIKVATDLGDMDLLHELVSETAVIDAEAARYLKKLLDNFELDKILFSLQ